LHYHLQLSAAKPIAITSVFHVSGALKSKYKMANKLLLNRERAIRSEGIVLNKASVSKNAG
jgi:hypothetical protein